MNRNDWLNFEIYVGDLLEEQNIRDADKLRDLSNNLHQQLEVAVIDYANDMGIEDYDPVY